jgi:hypothetical protein
MLGSKHWLQRAENARSVAQWINDPEGKLLLLEIAERYDKLARIPAAQVLGSPRQPQLRQKAE